MPMQFKMFLPSLRAGIQACSLILCTSQASQALAEPSINCKQGEYLAFSLQKAPFPLDRSKAQVVADFPWSFSDPMNTSNIRLDVCFDGTTQRAELQRVLWLNYAFATPNNAEGAGIIKVEGLAEALFGDYSNFEIRVVDESDSGLFVKGWGIGAQAFVTAVPVVFEGSGYQLTSIAFPAGVLVNADPFTGGPCPAGQSFGQSSFELGTASFQAETCMFLGGGQTMGYDIIKLSVQDSSPDLAPEYRSQVQVLSGEQLKSALNYRWNHHNACDSFYLNLGFAEYAATAAPLAGCGSPVANAPDRKHDDPRNETIYRTKYGSSAWNDEVELKSCPHYLINCQIW